MPERYAPQDAVDRPERLVGLRPRTAIPSGHDVSAGSVDATDDGGLRPGERIAEIAAVADPALVRPGVRIDLLVTRDRATGRGSTRLALEDAEVLRVAAPPEDAGDGGGRRLLVALRVTIRQAVYLTAAQNFARELRVLPRSPDDERRGATGLTVSEGLEAIR